MGGKSSMAFLAVILTASLLQSSAAQTNHVVGGPSGWTVPTTSGSGFYSSWAANQNLHVGDTLVFNFANGVHDVAKVTKADYDGCTTMNPILLENTSPARITLNATGEHYFICNFTGHCSAGQKLMINVNTVSSSPAPQPAAPVSSPSAAPQSSPSPVSSPSPAATPSSSSVPASPAAHRSSVTYTVLDSQGWIIPSNNTAAYQNWAANKTFMVGDVLVFNYPSGVHNVAEVTKEAYDSCNTTNHISLNTTPPTRITLTTTGEHFYICAVPRHCSLGQRLAINVSGTAAATPPGSSETPPPSSTPSSTGSSPPPLPSTTPSPTGSSTPPTSPPGNSAPALGVSSLFATIFTIFASLLY